MATTLAETDQDLFASRADPATFGQYATEGRWTPYRYQRYIARRIAKARARGNGRIVVNLPSRHGKSELCSLWTPAWLIDSLPEQRVILASYGAELAVNWGRQVRNEFEQNERLLTPLRDDSQAANRWNTPEGGGMLAVGVGGSVIGFGADLIIVDDPHKDWTEAHSRTVRERTVQWFGSTLYSRLEPGGTIVVLQQRLHEEDLSGFLIERHADPWEVISLPAVAKDNDPIGRKPGQALCPQRYDEDALAAIKRGMDAMAYAAMYDQSPLSAGSGRAYHAFDPAANEDKALRLRPDLPIHLAFDFNVNPGVHVIVGQYDSRRDLFTAVHEEWAFRRKTRETMHALNRYVAGQGGWRRFPEVHVFGDRAGNTQNTTTDATDYRIIGEELAAAGAKYRLRIQTANPPVKTRMTNFNEALHDSAGDVHFLVNPLGCPRLVNDLKLVKEDEDGLIDKSNPDLTHPSDAAGYWITYLRPVVRRTQSTEGRVSAVPQPA